MICSHGDGADCVWRSGESTKQESAWFRRGGIGVTAFGRAKETRGQAGGEVNHPPAHMAEKIDSIARSACEDPRRRNRGELGLGRDSYRIHENLCN